MAARWLVHLLLFAIASWLTISQPASAGVLAQKCQWSPATGSNQVMMTPAVFDLGNNTSRIVVVSFTDTADINNDEDGVLRILDGNCGVVQTVSTLGTRTCADQVTINTNQRGGTTGFLRPASGVAVGALTPGGSPDIIAVLEGPSASQPGRLVAFDSNGNFKWCSAPSTTAIEAMSAPALANLDGAASCTGGIKCIVIQAILNLPEIVINSKVFGSTGLLRWDGGNTGTSHATILADLDGDGLPEVVTGAQAWTSTTTPQWSTPKLLWDRSTGPAPIAGSGSFRPFPAIADMDHDNALDVVVTDSAMGGVRLLNGQTGADKCTTTLPVTSPQCPPGPQGGAPAIYSAHPTFGPVAGIAGCGYLTVFEYDSSQPLASCLKVLWSVTTQDYTSKITGVSAGRRTFFYNDETTLRTYDPATGVVIDMAPNSSATAIELPVIARLDSDSQASVIVASNDYFIGSNRGVRVLYTSDPTSSRVWNQHSYHITNVQANGTIPADEPPSGLYDGYRRSE